MHHHRGERGGKLDAEIAVGHAVERIFRRTGKAERRGRHRAVDRVGRAGQRARTKRADVHARRRVGDAPHVAHKHRRIRHQMVRQRDWLRALQVRITGHHRLQVLAGQIAQRFQKL